MATPLSVLALLVKQTADEIFTAALEIAELVGLPVTTWRTGDPTRTLFRAQAEKIAASDGVQTELAKSAFLETAEGDWLSLRASDTFGVERQEATYATPNVTIANAGAGYYEFAPGGLVLSSSVTGATFVNQATAIILPSAGATVVSMIAQVAGSEGSVSANDLDTITSPSIPDLSITSSTAGVGADEQSDAGLREQCLATLGSLSPAGPADAYEYVARNADLTGIQGVGRATAIGNPGTGQVTVYVATTTAALDAPSVAAIQAAIDEWATPVTAQATVLSATPQVFAVTLTLTPAHPELQDSAEAAIETYFAGVESGGVVAPDAIASAVRVAAANMGIALSIVAVSVPAAPTDLADNRFPVLGVLTLL